MRQSPEVVFFQPQHDGILQRLNPPGVHALGGAKQHPLAEVIALFKHTLKRFQSFAPRDGNLKRAFDDGVKAVGRHARLEHRLALAEPHQFGGGFFALLDLPQIARSKQIQRPVDDHAQLGHHAWQHAEIESAPHQPRQRPRQADAHDVGDGAVVADRRHGALRNVVERLGLLALQRGDDVGRQLLAFAHRELSGGRSKGIFAFFVFHRNQGRIAHGPHVFLTGHAHEGVGLDLATFFFDGHGFDQRRRSVADGGDDGGGFDLAAIVHFHVIEGRGFNAGVQPHFDALFFQPLGGIVGQAFGQLVQDATGEFHQQHAHFVLGDVGIELQRAVDHVFDFADGFHPGEARADHHEGQQAAAYVRVVHAVGIFQAIDHMVAQAMGMSRAFNRKSVLAQARHPVQADHLAHGQHQMVVGHFRDAAFRALGQGDAFGGEIDVENFRLHHRDVAQQLAQLGHRVRSAERACRDFRQQRLEGEVVGFADQHHFGSRGCDLRQILGREDARKTTTKYEYACH